MGIGVFMGIGVTEVKKNGFFIGTFVFFYFTELLKTLSESPKTFCNISSLIVRDPLRGTTAIFCGQDLISILETVNIV